MIEKQELYCHNCNNYVQFDLDVELDGNHVLHCPNCGHEHCRVVENGEITEDRWDSRNPSYKVSNVTYTRMSTWTSCTGISSSTNAQASGDMARMLMYRAWMNTTTVG